MFYPKVAPSGKRTTMGFLFAKIDQGPLITDGRNCNVDFVNRPTVGYPWHLKSSKDIITKFKWHEYQINRKDLVEVALILPTFLPS
jgi:hypothetical protein